MTLSYLLYIMTEITHGASLQEALAEIGITHETLSNYLIDHDMLEGFQDFLEEEDEPVVTIPCRGECTVCAE